MQDESNLDFENAIYFFTNYETKNWQKVLSLGNDENYKIEEKRRISWVWPTEENLKVLKVMLKKLKIGSILSIGCGCGLFEWILRESMGIKIYGLERDRVWWQSSHAVKSFVKLNYIDDLKPNCLPETFMQRCCDLHDKNNWRFAIMFVYFNDRQAFFNYLQMYKGQWIILVGPNMDVNIHTDPTPLEPKFPTETQWQLCEQISMDQHNVLAIYKNYNWKIQIEIN